MEIAKQETGYTQEQQRSFFFALLKHANQDLDPRVIAKISQAGKEAVVWLARQKPTWWIMQYAARDRWFFYLALSDEQITKRLYLKNIDYLDSTWFKAVLKDNKTEIVEVLLRYNVSIDKYIKIYENELKADNKYDAIGKILWAKQKLNNDLLLACKNSTNIEEIKELLDNGANPNGRFISNTDNSLGDETPFTFAVAMNPCNIEAIQLMLEHGADPNINYTVRTSPVTVAFNSNNLTLARLLLTHGAKVDYDAKRLAPDISKNSRNTIFVDEINNIEIIIDEFCQALADNNETKILKLLQQYPVLFKGQFNSKKYGNITALHFAFLKKSPAYKLLLNKGFNDYYILHKAVAVNYPEAVQYLTDNDLVNIDSCDRDGARAIGIAIKNGFTKCRKILSGKVKTFGFSNLSSFHILDEEHILRFLPNNLNNNKFFNDDNELLINAARNRQFRVVKFILNSGAYINLNNIGYILGKLPEQLAIRLIEKRKVYSMQEETYNDRNIVRIISQLLKRQKYNLASLYIEHASKEELENHPVNQLFYKDHYNKEKPKQIPLLSFAIKEGKTKIVRQLLDRGLDTNTTYTRRTYYIRNKSPLNSCGIYKKSIIGAHPIDLMLIKRGANYKKEITKNIFNFKGMDSLMSVSTIIGMSAAFALCLALAKIIEPFALLFIFSSLLFALIGAGIACGLMAVMAAITILIGRLLVAGYAKHFYKEPSNSKSFLIKNSKDIPSPDVHKNITIQADNSLKSIGNGNDASAIENSSIPVITSKTQPA